MSLNYENMETFETLIKVCRNYQVDPSSSLESESFFRTLLSNYEGAADTASVTSWLDANIARYFVALGKRPNWLQSAEWPFMGGAPMIFAGQIDWLVADIKLKSNVFHDDTSFYLFIAPKTPSVVVMQQM
jgi:hypothetical protein